MIVKGFKSDFGIENHDLINIKTAYWNLTTPTLVEHVIKNGEGELTNQGAVVVFTGQHTGRSPNDKFIVNGDQAIDDQIWWGKINQSISPEQFDRIFEKVKGYLKGKEIYIQDLAAGAHPKFQVPIRIISEKAYASLFARDLFIRLPADQVAHHHPRFTVIHTPDFFGDGKKDGLNSSTFIVINLQKGLVLIGGTSYAGEIKKSIFTVMNYLLPQSHVLPMHCSANVGMSGDIALFFGLSGTGKTTLSSDLDRMLIGDDEHGWSENGVFNFEGGCYAKTIHLRAELEPLIWSAVSRFGTVLENVVFDAYTRQPDFDDDRFTENTRAAYPLDYIPNHIPEGYAGHPQNVFFLTADAFGVLPPLSLLTPEQSMYYFLSGYTAKIAGTEKGLGLVPQATFSACFGAPFLPLHPKVYAELLGELISKHNVKVWLVNTGWSGGAYGTGSRINLPYTRAMISSALKGQIDISAMRKEQFFGLLIPHHCPGVPDEILNPINTWNNEADYRDQARNLMGQFSNNFAQYTSMVSETILNAGPHP